MRITRIAHACHAVSDAGRITAFRRDVPGLELSFSDPAPRAQFGAGGNGLPPFVRERS